MIATMGLLKKRVNIMSEDKLPIDMFAHVLAPKFYQKMLEIDPSIPDKFSYTKLPALTDMEFRRENMKVSTHQIISMMNLNPEDYVDPEQALKLCEFGNSEMIELVQDNPDQFIGSVAMIPMNNLAGAKNIMEEQVQSSAKMYGIQLFTRALGKSIADPEYDEIFATAEKLDMPIWLHPVFDERKPDNNITFSWEYELTQAMQQLVVEGVFQRYPNVKIIVHHAGAMVPFFAGRIDAIMTETQAEDFHKFYVDTAILGNPSALKLTIEYFGIDHVLFGTDAPFGIPPVGATEKIIEAVNMASNETDNTNKILFENTSQLLDI
jgi:predicted TIM-barrel fold metal-dependent hydrolase